MRILFVHNYYKIEGGEDTVVQQEVHLLRQAGHDVELFTVNNVAITGFITKLLTLVQTPFSLTGYLKIRRRLKEFKPDVVHVHNYFPLVSPSVFFACSWSNTPVVHTLHNYRSICPTSLLMIDGKIEERSIKHGPWWAVRKRVYKGSLLGTAALATMIAANKRMGTWQKKVSCFIALTEFSKNKFIDAGWPKNKVVVKPNFIEEPFVDGDTGDYGSYAIYVGRLSEEKGIEFLLDAWQNINLKLLVVSDGPLKSRVVAAGGAGIEYLGKKPKQEVLALIKQAQFIVMASNCYEGLPMVLVEAFACGTCAVVPRLGGMAEVVEDKKTGVHYTPGSKEDFSKQVEQLLDSNQERLKMGINARGRYLERYSPQKNLQELIAIYTRKVEGDGK